VALGLRVVSSERMSSTILLRVEMCSGLCHISVDNLALLPGGIGNDAGSTEAFELLIAASWLLVVPLFGLFNALP